METSLIVSEVRELADEKATNKEEIAKNESNLGLKKTEIDLAKLDQNIKIGSNSSHPTTVVRDPVGLTPQIFL